MLNKDLYIFVTQPDRKGEPMDADVLSEKAKKLKHVKVYNRLYSMIQDGVYPPGSQLPSEPELALQMDVSRMTLRRALALLQEDNLVINIRGKGKFHQRTQSRRQYAGPGGHTAPGPLYSVRSH